MTYSLSFNPIWYMVNLQGLQFDDTYYLFTLNNEFPYTYLPIYQDNQGIDAWSDPIQFLANGTLPSNMYWDDTQIYRLEIRQGNTQNAPLIYLIEDYVPNGESSGPITFSNNTQNQITNPQFADVLFGTQSFTITDNNVYTIAPGWQINAEGTGTLVITQLDLSGVPAVAGNPCFGISIANTNFSTVFLTQTFADNGNLWASESVAVSFNAQTLHGFTQLTVDLNYSDGSTPSNPILVVADTTASWTNYSAAIELPAATNPDLPPTANTSLQFSWSANVTMNLTNIQLVGQDITNATVPYNQTTVEQQTNGEFWYYKPELSFKPIPSLLTGWDFALNPAQESSSNSVTSTGAEYAWDQTIIQWTGALSYARDSITRGFQVTTGAATEAFALIQYLDSPEALKILNTALSVNLNAWATQANVTAQVYLYCGTSSATFPTISTPATIGTLAATGVFTLTASDWAAIPRNGLPQPSYTLTQVMAGAAPSGQVDFGSNNWELTSSLNITTTKCAIVVTFSCPTSGTVVTIPSISLVPGNIPTRPAPQTYDEVLRECQYYYEQSYAPGVIPAASTTTNQLLRLQNVYTASGATNWHSGGFDISWRNYKRAVPNVLLYSPVTGTSGNVVYTALTQGSVTSTGDAPLSTFFSTPIIGTYDISYTQGTGTYFFSNSSTTQLGSCSITLHYTADARLGVV